MPRTAMATRIPFAAGLPTLLLLAAACASQARASEPAFRAAGPGWFEQAPDGAGTAERFELSPDIVPLLASREPGDAIRIADWPVAPGVRGIVRLTRHDVYAPAARVLVVGPTGDQPIARSRLAFLWGEADDRKRSRVLAIVDAGSDSLHAFAETDDGWNELRPARDAHGGYVLAAAKALLGDAADRMTRACSLEPLLPPGRGTRLDLPTAAPAGHEDHAGGLAADVPSFLERLRAATTAAGVAVDAPETTPETRAALLAGLRQMTVAFDTDNEFMQQKFANDATAATNYIASLTALMSTVYERDLGLRLLVGTTLLRPSTTTDPWLQADTGNASSAKITELRTYWAANHAAVARGATMLLSGKQANAYSSSGIGYINALCDKSFGYAFVQVFKFPGSTPSSDLMVSAHELGHVAGSRHSHCYLSPEPIDTCYSGESGCYSGTTTCPAAQTINGVANVRGTLMSYCHVLSGCSSSTVFHPRTVALLAPIVDAKTGACISNVTASVPKEASPNGSVKAARAAGGGGVTVTYSPACGATSHTAYVGDLTTLRSAGIAWSQRYCNLGTTGTATFNPTGAAVYFVVAGNNGSVEGSYGRGGNGAERPAAGSGGACAYTQQLSGSCP